jgi:dipeptidase E
MKIIIASTSTVYGGKYLAYLKPALTQLYNGIDEIVFIPYARPSGLSHDAYTEVAAKFFATINIKVKGIHEFDNPKSAINNAQAVFTGGGNTFLLVSKMYENDLWEVLRQRINNEMPYLGTSAGSNITGQSMHNTNDMPIIEVPSYKTLGVFPFNINPHYLDPAPDLLKHMGETRETRIKEYLHFNDVPVVALREGSWIEGKGKQFFLRGNDTARVYFSLNDIREIETNTELTNLF